MPQKAAADARHVATAAIELQAYDIGIYVPGDRYLPGDDASGNYELPGACGLASGAKRGSLFQSNQGLRSFTPLCSISVTFRVTTVKS